MKKLVFLFIVLLLSQFNLTAQEWHTEIQLVSTGSDASQPDIAVFDNNIHVIWEDGRDGSNSQIYYKRSTDHGSNWIPDERLSVDAEESCDGSIATMGTNVYVAWCDEHDHVSTGSEIYYRRSTNNGDWFEPTIRITYSGSKKYCSDIAVFGDNIHIVWEDDRSDFDIYYKHSSDNGLTWSAELLLTNPANADLVPKIAVSGDNVFLTWISYRSGIQEVYFRRSPDNGISWDPEQKLSFSNSPYTNGVDITAFDNNIHIEWIDYRTGTTGEIFYRHSFNLGVDWSAETRLTFNPGGKYGTSITCFQEKIHIAWADYRGVNTQVFYLKSIDNGENWDTEMPLSTLLNNSYIPSMAAFEENVFAVWADNPGGVLEIIFRRYMSPTSIVYELKNLPEEYKLDQNYPNPFNNSTVIKYSIPQEGLVILKVYNLLGEEVARIVNDIKQTGNYEISFDATGLLSGIYFYRLQAGNFLATKKMVLLR